MFSQASNFVNSFVRSHLRAAAALIGPAMHEPISAMICRIWILQPLFCMPMVTGRPPKAGVFAPDFLQARSLPGHNCFGAVLHPIPMVDFMFTPPYTRGFSLDSFAFFWQVWPTLQTACKSISLRFHEMLLPQLPCVRLDGIISGFPNTYASKFCTATDRQ